MTPEKNDLFLSIDFFASLKLDWLAFSDSGVEVSPCLLRLNSSFDRFRVKGGGWIVSASIVGAVVIIAGAKEKWHVRRVWHMSNIHTRRNSRNWRNFFPLGFRCRRKLGIRGMMS